MAALEEQFITEAGDRVFFSAGSAELGSRARGVLQAQARFIKLRPDLLWSLGPMTLPHELAAIIAAEQIYRAFTILHHLPYHAGH